MAMEGTLPGTGEAADCETQNAPPDRHPLAWNPVKKKTRSRISPWLQDLLDRADEEMALRGFTGQTRRLYLAPIRRFYEHRLASGWHPEPAFLTLGSAADPTPLVLDHREVRDWLLTLLRSKHSHSYVNQALSALRFLYRRVLDAPAPVADIPRPKRKKTLPKVLSKEEIRSFLGALRSWKHRAIAMVLYSGGLRVSEAARLRVEDIESERGQIRIRQGKGRKDRYVML